MCGLEQTHLYFDGDDAMACRSQASAHHAPEVTVMGRILIADDHDALRRGLVRALTAAGNDVDEAPDGNAAIQRLHNAYFDVVLTDLRIGGNDGFEVLRTAKALQPSAAVILMTASGSVTVAVEAMKSGAFDFVQKPFEIEEMEAKVQKALELRRGGRERDQLGMPDATVSSESSAGVRRARRSGMPLRFPGAREERAEGQATAPAATEDQP